MRKIVKKRYNLNADTFVILDVIDLPVSSCVIGLAFWITRREWFALLTTLFERLKEQISIWVNQN